MALPPAPAAFAQASSGVTAQDADIRAFIQDVARATGTTFIIDPAVQGSVNITRDVAMDEAELLGVLLAVLRANGLVAVSAGPGAYRVVPDTAAAQLPGSGVGGSAFTTQVLPLSSVDARIAAETLKPLVGRGGVVVPTPQGNALLIADYADNIRRIRGLVAQIDSDTAGIDTVTLRNSSAREVAATVNQLFGGGEARGGQLSIQPVEGSNSIVVRGAPSAVQRVVQTILELDRRAERTGGVRVVRLQHASAEQLLPVLQQLVGQSPDGEDGAGTVAASAANPDAAAAQLITAVPGKRPTIVRYPGSNSLIINADPETQRLLVDVITQLDTRREQVLVEAIVVEISDNAARRLGAQLLIAGKDGSNIPFLATQYPGASPGIMPLAGGWYAEQRRRDGDDDDDDDDGALELARRAAIQSLLGINGALAGIAGSNDNATFGLIIDAVNSDTASNLLSTPSILTLDNEEARILVGQEVPTTTGEVLGDSNSNPFRTIQRQDVGIQLEVTPQINAGGGITLTLRQEVSSIAGPVSEDFSELVLNKREVETRVLVDDGEIVALGGLLDQADRNTVSKVPLLGDIPIVGQLFRHRSRSRDKTNLMVFIRPTIVRSTADAQAMSANRYGYMRSQLPVVGERENALDELVRDYLRTTPPAMPPPAPTTAPTTAPVPAPTYPAAVGADDTR
ncbi:type II secretion system secretin GspD [Luteimonas sp. M1R5S59]|uniref:Type II secretion system secretin GspD n=1 Tax=Luteimonas kalidii TaxID=3042025 RepID=A0ABT6JQC4_9GAMM|nr:type II secretion system secretin GspD [Luteimonas kalidii]MDH5832865.1 type II secretion system secretin GspD [Luteimonas kalidii]